MDTLVIIAIILIFGVVAFGAYQIIYNNPLRKLYNFGKNLFSSSESTPEQEKSKEKNFDRYIPQQQTLDGSTADGQALSGFILDGANDTKQAKELLDSRKQSAKSFIEKFTGIFKANNKAKKDIAFVEKVLITPEIKKQLEPRLGKDNIPNEINIFTLAVIFNRVDIVKHILETEKKNKPLNESREDALSTKSPINYAMGENRRTALHYAAMLQTTNSSEQEANDEIITALIDAGANRNSRDVIIKNQSDTSTIGKIVSKILPKNEGAVKGNKTPVFYAMEAQKTRASYKLLNRHYSSGFFNSLGFYWDYYSPFGSNEEFRALVRKDIYDINIPDAQGHTIATKAAEIGDLTQIKNYKRLGLDIEAASCPEILIAAARGKHLNIIKHFYDKYSSGDALKGPTHEKVLVEAVTLNYASNNLQNDRTASLESLKYLIPYLIKNDKYNAITTARNEQNANILHIAIQNGETDIAKFIFKECLKYLSKEMYIIGGKEVPITPQNENAIEKKEYVPSKFNNLDMLALALVNNQKDTALSMLNGEFGSDFKIDFNFAVPQTQENYLTLAAKNGMTEVVNKLLQLYKSHDKDRFAPAKAPAPGRFARFGAWIKSWFVTPKVVVETGHTDEQLKTLLNCRNAQEQNVLLATVSAIETTPKEELPEAKKDEKIKALKQITKTLLKEKIIDLSVKDSSKKSFLHYFGAINAMEDKELLDAALDSNLDFFDADDQGNNFLHIVASKGNKSALETAINKITQRNKEAKPKTEQNYAAVNKTEDNLLHLALASQPDKNSEGQVIQYPPARIDTALYILSNIVPLIPDEDKKKFLNAANKACLTPLLLAIGTRNEALISEFMTDPIKSLIDMDANTKTTGLLHFALAKGIDFKTIQEKFGTYIDAEDVNKELNGKSLLHDLASDNRTVDQTNDKELLDFIISKAGENKASLLNKKVNDARKTFDTKNKENPDNNKTAIQLVLETIQKNPSPFFINMFKTLVDEGAEIDQAVLDMFYKVSADKNYTYEFKEGSIKANTPLDSENKSINPALLGHILSKQLINCDDEKLKTYAARTLKFEEGITIVTEADKLNRTLYNDYIFPALAKSSDIALKNSLLPFLKNSNREKEYKELLENIASTATTDIPIAQEICDLIARGNLQHVKFLLKLVHGNNIHVPIKDINQPLVIVNSSSHVALKDVKKPIYAHQAVKIIAKSKSSSVNERELANEIFILLEALGAVTSKKKNTESTEKTIVNGAQAVADTAKKGFNGAIGFIGAALGVPKSIVKVAKLPTKAEPKEQLDETDIVTFVQELQNLKPESKLDNKIKQAIQKDIADLQESNTKDINILKSTFLKNILPKLTLEKSLKIIEKLDLGDGLAVYTKLYYFYAEPNLKRPVGFTADNSTFTAEKCTEIAYQFYSLSHHSLEKLVQSKHFQDIKTLITWDIAEQAEKISKLAKHKDQQNKINNLCQLFHDSKYITANPVFLELDNEEKKIDFAYEVLLLSSGPGTNKNLADKSDKLFTIFDKLKKKRLDYKDKEAVNYFKNFWVLENIDKEELKKAQLDSDKKEIWTKDNFDDYIYGLAIDNPKENPEVSTVFSVQEYNRGVKAVNYIKTNRATIGDLYAYTRNVISKKSPWGSQYANQLVLMVTNPVATLLKSWEAVDKGGNRDNSFTSISPGHIFGFLTEGYQNFSETKLESIYNLLNSYNNRKLIEEVFETPLPPEQNKGKRFTLFEKLAQLDIEKLYNFIEGKGKVKDKNKGDDLITTINNATSVSLANELLQDHFSTLHANSCSKEISCSEEISCRGRFLNFVSKNALHNLNLNLGTIILNDDDYFDNAAKYWQNLYDTYKDNPELLNKILLSKQVKLKENANSTDNPKIFDTLYFLIALDNLTCFINIIGNQALSPVREDMVKNIEFWNHITNNFRELGTLGEVFKKLSPKKLEAVLALKIPLEVGEISIAQKLSEQEAGKKILSDIDSGTLKDKLFKSEHITLKNKNDPEEIFNTANSLSKDLATKFLFEPNQDLSHCSLIDNLLIIGSDNGRQIPTSFLQNLEGKPKILEILLDKGFFSSKVKIDGLTPNNQPIKEDRKVLDLLVCGDLSIVWDKNRTEDTKNRELFFHNISNYAKFLQSQMKTIAEKFIPESKVNKGMIQKLTYLKKLLELSYQIDETTTIKQFDRIKYAALIVKEQLSELESQLKFAMDSNSPEAIAIASQKLKEFKQHDYYKPYQFMLDGWELVKKSMETATDRKESFPGKVSKDNPLAEFAKSEAFDSRIFADLFQLFNGIALTITQKQYDEALKAYEANFPDPVTKAFTKTGNFLKEVITGSNSAPKTPNDIATQVGILVGQGAAAVGAGIANQTVDFVGGLSTGVRGQANAVPSLNSTQATPQTPIWTKAGEAAGKGAGNLLDKATTGVKNKLGSVWNNLKSSNNKQENPNSTPPVSSPKKSIHELPVGQGVQDGKLEEGTPSVPLESNKYTLTVTTQNIIKSQNKETAAKVIKQQEEAERKAEKKKNSPLNRFGNWASEKARVADKVITNLVRPNPSKNSNSKRSASNETPPASTTNSIRTELNETAGESNPSVTTTTFSNNIVQVDLDIVNPFDTELTLDEVLRNVEKDEKQKTKNGPTPPVSDPETRFYEPEQSRQK